MAGRPDIIQSVALLTTVSGLAIAALKVELRHRRRAPARVAETGLETYFPAELVVGGVRHQGEAVQADPYTDLRNTAADRDNRGGRHGDCETAGRLGSVTLAQHDERAF